MFKLAIEILSYKKRMYDLYEIKRKLNTMHPKVDYDVRRREIDLAIKVLKEYEANTEGEARGARQGEDHE